MFYMIQKTKKQLAFVLGAIVMSFFGTIANKNFSKDGALFSGINVAQADIPATGTDPSACGGDSSDSGCSGCGGGP